MPEKETQTQVGTYCGKKPSASKPAGTPNYCYRKGLKVGFVGALKKTEPEQKRKTKLIVEAGLKHKQLINDIKTKGLRALKNVIRLDELNKYLLNFSLKVNQIH